MPQRSFKSMSVLFVKESTKKKRCILSTVTDKATSSKQGSMNVSPLSMSMKIRTMVTTTNTVPGIVFFMCVTTLNQRHLIIISIALLPSSHQYPFSPHHHHHNNNLTTPVSPTSPHHSIFVISSANITTPTTISSY